MWAKASDADIEGIEQLLCYFQADCATVVETMGHALGLAFHANVAIAATEMYVARHNKKNFRAQLLETTKRYHDQLTAIVKKHDDNQSLPTPPRSWIDYSTVVEKDSAKAAASATAPTPAITYLPRIIVHSEVYVDRGLEPQHTPEREVTTKASPKWIPLPWKEWLHSAVAQNMDAVVADTSAVTQVLRGLHVHEEL